MTMGSDAAGLAGFDSASSSALRKVSRFNQPAAAKDLAEAESRSSEEKADDAVARIFEKINKRLITPFLRAETRQACWEILSENFSTYTECSEALRVVVAEMDADAKKLDDAAFLTNTSYSIALHTDQSAADEFAFSWKTYGRAMRLLEKLLAEQREPSDLDRDRKAAEQFRVQATLHNIGMLAILHAYKVVNPTKAAWELSFDLARGGALRTYSALREALELRREQVDVHPSFESGFDGEGAYLAGITGH